jgi:AcrR family transcriptional regulator
MHGEERGMQQRSQETRERILEAALKVFAERGYDGASVTQICKHAGVSKGALYHHYPTKHAVFLALLEQWLTGIDVGLGSLRASQQDFPELLLQMADFSRLIFDAADENLPMFLEFWSQASHDPAVWEATIAPYRRYRDYFADLVEEGIASGSLKPVDPQVAAYLIVAVALGMLLQGMLDNETAQRREMPRKMIELMLDGMRRRER